MEFNEKLHELRRQKGLTQEELATQLYVSRTAISKWESGRGYPNIDSLKSMAKFFGVTVDELLSGDELLTIAEEDCVRNQMRLCDLVFGLLDCSIAIFFFLPLFGQKSGDWVQSVSLLSLHGISAWLQFSYYTVIICMIITGILSLALQAWQNPLWLRHKHKLSLTCNAVGTLLFIVSLQPYAAALLFLFLIIKVFSGKRRI